MATLKLIPGQRINFTVADVERVQGNFGPQYAFKGQTPDDANATLYLNLEPAERQLARIGLDNVSVIGRTVEFARTEKNGTKYTDINLPANGTDKPKPLSTSGKAPYSSGPALPYETESETGAPPPALPSVAALDAIFATYSACFAFAHKLAHDKMGADSTHEGIAAMAATTFIAAKGR